MASAPSSPKSLHIRLISVSAGVSCDTKIKEFTEILLSRTHVEIPVGRSFYFKRGRYASHGHSVPWESHCARVARCGQP